MASTRLFLRNPFAGSIPLDFLFAAQANRVKIDGAFEQLERDSKLAPLITHASDHA
jgi:hypothetical protein